DFFLSIFSESHCIGHQQWHLHDHTHPRFDRTTLEGLGSNPVTHIYRELDTALGDMLARACDDTVVLVLLSHGMGPHYDGTHLLDTILSRIDGFNRATGNDYNPRKLRNRVVASLPRALQESATAFAVPVIRHYLKRRSIIPCSEYASRKERARQSFFMEPNNFVYGGIRLNLKGREPAGCIQPQDADAVCKRLADDLLALVNVDAGGPVIRAVEPADRWYRRANDDTMPDLFIDWERAAAIETVWSPKTGIVHAPYTNWRSGDHRPEGLLFAYGPGIPTKAVLPGIDIEDLAPSI